MKGVILVLTIAVLAPPLYAADCNTSIIPTLSDPEGKSNQVTPYLSALSGTVLFADDKVDGSYCQLHGWYEKHMSSGRLSSRMLAVLIIVLGASLPLIGILDKTFTNQKFWVAFVGASVVIAQGFAQTFQYDESWRNFTMAKLELENAHREWQRKIVDASLKSNGLELAQEATREFDGAVANIVTKETTGFFDSLSQGKEGQFEHDAEAD